MVIVFAILGNCWTKMGHLHAVTSCVTATAWEVVLLHMHSKALFRGPAKSLSHLIFCFVVWAVAVAQLCCCTGCLPRHDGLSVPVRFKTAALCILGPLHMMAPILRNGGSKYLHRSSLDLSSLYQLYLSFCLLSFPLKFVADIAVQVIRGNNLRTRGSCALRAACVYYASQPIRASILRQVWQQGTTQYAYWPIFGFNVIREAMIIH